MRMKNAAEYIMFQHGIVHNEDEEALQWTTRQVKRDIIQTVRLSQLVLNITYGLYFRHLNVPSFL